MMEDAGGHEERRRLFDHPRAAGGEGPSDRRRRRRRVRHPRLHRRFRRKDRKQLGSFYTIPAPGEPGSDTWDDIRKTATAYCDPEAWKHGAGSAWVTGSYDPSLNLIYWGIGNVGPDYNGDQRPGDNLYTAP